MAIPNNYPELFYHYSKLVTGEDSLSRKLSNVYFEIFNADPAVQTDFLRLLDVYQEILNKGETDHEPAIKEKILPDTNLNAITLSIIKLWYLGIIKSLTTNSQNTEPLKGGGYYFHHEALIWKIARAHPAGLSGGYYGYWSYKPEN